MTKKFEKSNLGDDEMRIEQNMDLEDELLSSLNKLVGKPNNKKNSKLLKFSSIYLQLAENNRTNESSDSSGYNTDESDQFTQQHTISMQPGQF